MDFSEKIVQYIITLLLVFSISVNEHFSMLVRLPHTTCAPPTLLLNSHQIHIDIIKEIYLLFYINLWSFKRGYFLARNISIVSSSQ